MALFNQTQIRFWIYKWARWYRRSISQWTRPRPSVIEFTKLAVKMKQYSVALHRECCDWLLLPTEKTWFWICDLKQLFQAWLQANWGNIHHSHQRDYVGRKDPKAAKLLKKMSVEQHDVVTNHILINGLCKAGGTLDSRGAWKRETANTMYLVTAESLIRYVRMEWLMMLSKSCSL